jgi:hypothetical protein
VPGFQEEDRSLSRIRLAAPAALVALALAPIVPSTAAAAPAPVARVAPKVHVTGTGAVALAVACASPRAACSGVISLHLGERPFGRVGTARFRVRGGGSAIVPVRLSDRGVAAVASGRRAWVRALVVTRSPAGTRSTARRLLLRQPGRPAAPRLLRGLASETSERAVTVAFAHAETGMRFRCRTAGVARPCRSPLVLGRLEVGHHAVEIVARDRFGADSRPLAVRFRVTPLAAPELTGVGAASVGSGPTATFSLRHAGPGVSFVCRLDGAPFAACPASVVLSGLAAGSHTFAAKARNATGRESATVTHAWSVAPPPAPPTLTEAPRERDTRATSTFRFSSPTPSVTYQCSLDGAAWAACGSPVVYERLGTGAHSFAVRARDAWARESLATTSRWTVALPDLLPDLRPVLDDLTMTEPPGAETDDGLWFSSEAQNHGVGPLELNPGRETCDGPESSTANMRIFSDVDRNGYFTREVDGRAYRDERVGCNAFHPAHDHWHFGDFAAYKLYRLENGRASGPPVSTSEKVSFCLIDEHHRAPRLPGSPADPLFTTATVCASKTAPMGISIGYGDEYAEWRPDQYVALGHLNPRDGAYCLVNIVDPSLRIPETNDGNNTTSLRVSIQGQTVTRGAPGTCHR